MTDDVAPDPTAETQAEGAAYQHWRDESKRAEREFRAATKKPREGLEAALEESDRRHKERVGTAKRTVAAASQAHRRDVELARIEYRKSIDLAEANLKEAMARARGPVRDAEAAHKTSSEQSRRVLEAEIAKARDAFEKATGPAYIERRRIKTESWGAYLRAHETATSAPEESS